MNKVLITRKSLQQLSFKDNFMFAAVMLDAENAKGVLERALGVEIDRVEVSVEKSIVYNPEYKGIRLDVYLKDDKDRRFNVEMQVANKKIVKRARYYHSQVDMELLNCGIDYEELPSAYVIFICDFDPFGFEKFRYTVKQSIEECEAFNYDDGSYTVFLNTKGTNVNEVSSDLVNFLRFAGAEIENSQDDFADDFVERLQRSVEKIKFDREMGRRYMLFEEIRKEEFKAGKAEGKAEDILSFLSDIASVNDDLKERIMSIDSIELLSILLKKSANAKSIDEFEGFLNEMKL